jgi:uncharacterized protein
MPTPIRNSKVLLTGATGGIGRAIARDLHRRGAHLTITGRRVEVLDQIQAELGDSVEVLALDLADRDAVKSICERTEFDVLIANAALPASGRYDGSTPEQIDRALDVNLRAPMMMTRAMAPAMVERGRGHVVLVSSLNGKISSPTSSIYSATKFGLRGFGFGVNEDLHDTPVGVTTVFPGFIRESGMFHNSGAKLPKGVPTRTAEQVAQAVVIGIEKGKAEIDVAPISLRAGPWLFNIAPSFVAAIQRKLGAEALGTEIHEGHEGHEAKRS